MKNIKITNSGLDGLRILCTGTNDLLDVVVA